MSYRNDATYVEDAIRADAILDSVAGMDRNDFLTDARTQAAVMHELTILGEACNRVSRETKARHPEIPWHQASGLRNRLIHGYFDVNVQVVWDTVVSDLDGLRTQLVRVLAEL
jgi:uncharacterized protein with HEPN domain